MPSHTTHIAPTCHTGTNACGRLLRVDDGTGDQLNDFYDFLDSEINNNGAIDMNINIQNNPNNAGGGAVPNVNE